MALCHSQVTLMLFTDITLQKPHIPASFNMYLVINRWVIAVKVSNFSGQYLRNHWTLDIGVLGYISIVLPKEHSPVVWSVPPVTPCIYMKITCQSVCLTAISHQEMDIVAWNFGSSFKIFLGGIFITNFLKTMACIFSEILSIYGAVSRYHCFGRYCSAVFCR